jgi:hypothetical protein
MRAAVGTTTAFPPVGLARQPPLPPKSLSLSPRPLAHVSPAWLARRRTVARCPALGRGKPPSSSPRFPPFFPSSTRVVRPRRGPAMALVRPGALGLRPSLPRRARPCRPLDPTPPRGPAPPARLIQPPGLGAVARPPAPLPAWPPSQRGLASAPRGAAWSSARRAHGVRPGARSARTQCLGPRRGPAACSRRAARRVRAARLWRVSVALRERVLAWCTWCFGTARRALCAHLPLDVPVYP